MKKIGYIVVLMFVVLVLVGCAAQPSAFSQKLIGLPEDGKTLIAAFVTAGVAWLLLQVGMWLNMDTSKYVQPLAAAIAPILVMFVEYGLALIPPAFDDITLAVLHWLVLLISGSVGAFVLVKRSKTPQRLLS